MTKQKEFNPFRTKAVIYQNMGKAMGCDGLWLWCTYTYTHMKILSTIFRINIYSTDDSIQHSV